MTWRPPAPWRALHAGVLGALLVALTACSAGDTGGAGPSAPGGAEAPLVPVESEDAVQLGDVTMAVPQGFEVVEPEQPDGAYQVAGPIAEDGTRPFLTIQSEKTSESLEQSSTAFADYLTEVEKATDVEHTAVEWPGAQESRFMSYSRRMPLPDGGDVVVRFETLSLLADGREVVVAGAAEEGAFESSGIHEALGSVRLAGRSS